MLGFLGASLFFRGLELLLFMLMVNLLKVYYIFAIILISVTMILFKFFFFKRTIFVKSPGRKTL